MSLPLDRCPQAVRYRQATAADILPDPEAMGRFLLGCALAVGQGQDLVFAEITETEAYLGEQDPASHAWKGLSKRNAVMFGPVGRLYTYTMHGHTCCNVVCTPAGVAGAVLIRAGRILEGLDLARARRGEMPDERLGRGPGCLTKALGITMGDSAADLLDPASHVRLLIPTEPEAEDGAQPGADSPRAEPQPEAGHLTESHSAARSITAGPRVGVPRAHEEPLRFFFTGDRTVSAYKKSKAIS